MFGILNFGHCNLFDICDLNKFILKRRFIKPNCILQITQGTAH